MKLEGKIALVTGGSQGLGKAIALKLAENGADIAVVYVGPEEPALETCREIEAMGRRAKSYVCDVRDEAAVETTVEAVKNDLGKVDILVNNAGVTRDGLMVGMKDEDYDMVLDINLKGAFHMTRACYRDFMRKKAGKIINISSIAGLVGNVGQVNYAASKAGLIGMSKSIAKELGSRGVCCNCIAPGFIATEMTKDIKEDNPLLQQVPMKKMGTPEDVANMALFLASPESDYVTGETIRVDGGLAI
ncbi:3-oxoacyl-[acyl-carrier-protein] reductase [Neglectibacter caecimuris]|jgi:3-oxoacyl-[acyl-carrier protein] reductase|uniref:3-oxoacyl-[acyl-carrier-protein] reductase n=1 Tax=Neglectibacter caecimuris TaxID=3093658 RepID=UPI002AC92163|nr:3-oxoacyl-[acyl-carrier-protein] reductase [Neglectibacter sp. M00184]